MKKYKILLVGGGSGGHIFPLVAIGEALKERNITFAYIGTKKSKEEEVAQEENFDFIPISSGKWRRYYPFRNFFKNVSDVLKVIYGFFQCLIILRKTGASTVFSKGGYVALPMVFAAKLLGRKIIVHESDSAIGLTNGLSVRFANKVLTAFDPKVLGFNDDRFIQVGIPIRKAFLKSAKSKSPQKKRPVLLVLSGSQGSKFINGLIKSELSSLLEKYEVIHSTGEQQYEEMLEAKSLLSEELKERYRPYDFIGRELPYYMQLADLIIGRSGATAIVEASVFSKKMLVIPLPTAARNHQLLNAKLLAKAGALEFVEQHQVNPNKIIEKIDEIINHPKHKNLGENLYKYFDEESTMTKVLNVLGINDKEK